MNDGSLARLPDEARPIEAWLSSMSERTRALLEFHFDRDAGRAFALASSAAAADVVIVDYDYPGARAALEGGKWVDGPPLVVLAHGTPVVDGALVLAKPLDRSSLDTAAERLRAAPPGTRPSGPVGARPDDAAPPSMRVGATTRVLSGVPATPPVDRSPEPSPPEPPAEARATSTSGSPSEPPPEPSPEPSPEPPLLKIAPGRRRAPPRDPVAVAIAPRGERARARESALCGPPRSLAELAAPRDPEHRYDPTRHFGGHLAAALDGLEADGSDVRGLTLSVSGVEFHVLPWLDRIYTSEPMTWQVDVDRVFRELDDADVTLLPYRATTVNTLVARVNANASQAFPVSAFRWLAALFSARGRLPHGVGVDDPFVLAHWPNLSRLELTPACLSIVTEWTSRPCSISAMVERVGCEPRHVTALYAAASERGLLRRATGTNDSFRDDGDDDGTA